MYLGGPAKQQLVDLGTKMHHAYHSGLDKILPRQWGKAYYDGLSGPARNAMLQKLAAYTKAFDKQNGTNLIQAMFANGFPF